MSGKVGAKKRDGTRYRNYWCTAAIRSKGLCAHPNGHSVPKLEKAVLEYLGRFSDPSLVKEHMAAAERSELERKNTELDHVSKALTDLESQFQKRLDLLTRGVINEDEFQQVNSGIREQREALEFRKSELERWLKDQQGKVSAAEEMPAKIGSFSEDIGHLDVRIAKARLQSILRTIHVTRDEIEVEFRA